MAIQVRRPSKAELDGIPLPLQRWLLDLVTSVGKGVTVNDLNQITANGATTTLAVGTSTVTIENGLITSVE
jgi:hypothetical protein